jgi:hypothetical protein
MHEAQSSTLRPDLFPFATTPLPHHRAHQAKKEQSAEKKVRRKNMPAVGCRERVALVLETILYGQVKCKSAHVCSAATQRALFPSTHTHNQLPAGRLYFLALSP